jgi:hypothetical protein
MLDTKQSWDDLIRLHAPDAATRDAILANPLYQNITGKFVQSHDYVAMERLYEIHNDRFGVDKDKEKSRCGLRARARALHRRVFFTIDCSGSKCPRHK